MSGDSFYILLNLTRGDNAAARHIKRQQRRTWYRGNTAQPIRCQRLVIISAREEEASQAVRTKRAAQKARASAARAAAEQPRPQQSRPPHRPASDLDDFEFDDRDGSEVSDMSDGSDMSDMSDVSDS